MNPIVLRRQMEEEALKLKQMQSEVDSSFTSPGAGLNTSRDARSISDRAFLEAEDAMNDDNAHPRGFWEPHRIRGSRC